MPGNIKFSESHSGYRQKVEMVRYVLAAATLKMFSSTPRMKQIYRQIGNTWGSTGRSRGRMPKFYLDRVHRMLEINKHHRILKEGSRLLELGTGWLHWEALTCRLFFDVQCTLYDVWDNRQLSGLKNYISQLDARLEELNVPNWQLQRARSLILKVLKVEDFLEFYNLLGFEYVVADSRGLKQFNDASFDFVVSAGVLEHIPAETASEIIKDTARILKPGGYSFQDINLRDHLYQYDETVSSKQYLHYSDHAWKRWFENDVQYINRLQRPEWLRFFGDTGLNLIVEESEIEDLTGLRPDIAYMRYSNSDRQCSQLRLLHRKQL
jgi:SAM-dependent methyltransferase